MQIITVLDLIYIQQSTTDFVFTQWKSMEGVESHPESGEPRESVNVDDNLWISPVAAPLSELWQEAEPCGATDRRKLQEL